MSENSKIEWTDATVVATVPYGIKNRRHEVGGKALRVVTGRLHGQDHIRREVVHLLQGVARPISIRRGCFSGRRIGGTMFFGSQYQSKICLHTERTSEGRPSPVRADQRWRQAASEEQGKLPAPNGANPRPKHASVHGLRTHRAGGAS